MSPGPGCRRTALIHPRQPDTSGPVATPKEARSPFTAVFAAVAGCAASLLLLYILVRGNYEVLDKGALLPYTSAEIYRIELFGRITVYAQPEAKTSFDILDSWILISVSSVALLALIFLWTARVATEARTAGFFFAAWLGAGFLAVDEIVGAHENLGHNLRFLAIFRVSRAPTTPCSPYTHFLSLDSSSRSDGSSSGHERRDLLRARRRDLPGRGCCRCPRHRS